MVDEPSTGHYQLERSLSIKARCDFRSTIALRWHLAILLLRHLALEVAFGHTAAEASSLEGHRIAAAVASDPVVLRTAAEAAASLVVVASGAAVASLVAAVPS